VRVARRRVEDWHGVVVSDAARGSGRCASGGVMPHGFPGVPSQGLDLVEPVMYLSWTGDVPVVHRRIPALVTRRITRPQGPLAAAVSEVPGRLK
jgi:hypothetical protein